MDIQLKEIVDKIVAHVDPVKIFLFGSRARGDARPDSDYDIAVVYDGEKSKGDVELDIYKLFMHARLAMDVFILSSEELEMFKPVATTLAREITENGIVVFG